MAEIKTYQYVNQKPKQENKLLSFFRQIDRYECGDYLITLLLCKTSVLGSMSPLGIAFFAATLLRERTPLTLLFAVLGIALGGFGIESFKYIGAAVVYAIFALILKNDLRDKKYVLASVASVSLLLNGLMFLFFQGIRMYDFLRLLIECVLTFAAFLAFDRGASLLRNFKNRSVFENDETLSLVLLAGSVILSVATIPYLRGAAHILSIYVILALSLCCGFAVSAPAGILLGLINSMGNVMSSSVIGVYAFCGLAAGMFKRFGKWGVSAAFLVSNAAIMLYLNNSTDRIITIYYIAAATALFFFTPPKLLSQFGKVALPIHPAEGSCGRERDFITERLGEVSKSFYRLADTFTNLAEYRVNTDVKDVTVLFDRVAQDVCASCSMNTHCWQQEFNDTYNLLMKSFEAIEQKGYVAPNNMPKPFADKCIRFESFLDSYERNYALYQSDVMWAGKVLESRTLVADQFKNVSAILDSLRTELSADAHFDEQLAQKVHAALDQNGIRAEDVSVACRDGYEVRFRMRSCGGNFRCSSIGTSVLSEVLEAPMLRTNMSCGSGICDITFREQAKYRLDVGLARTQREGQRQSGDNYTFMALDDTRYLLALSDGMGSGKGAKVQSSLTIDLVEKLLESGFDKDTAVRLINSVLLLRSDKESFATMDLCIVNLYRGELEFVKIGAASSYLKRGDEVRRVESTSLPVGIVSQVDPEHSIAFVSEGDFVVMVTDGITDCEDRSIKNLDAITDVIRNYNGISAQELADRVLHTALSLSGGVADDDMTVLAANIRTF